MTLQDIYNMDENRRTAANKRYSVEFYSRVIADLIDRKQYAKTRYWYKKDYSDGLINWLNARYPAVLVTRFVVDLIENIK